MQAKRETVKINGHNSALLWVLLHQLTKGIIIWEHVKEYDFAVTLKDVKLFIVNRQNVSEIFVNIHNVNLFNVKPKELSKAGLYVCKGTKQ